MATYRTPRLSPLPDRSKWSGNPLFVNGADAVFTNLCTMTPMAAMLLHWRVRTLRVSGGPGSILFDLFPPGAGASEEKLLVGGAFDFTFATGIADSPPADELDLLRYDWSGGFLWQPPADPGDSAVTFTKVGAGWHGEEVAFPTRTEFLGFQMARDGWFVDKSRRAGSLWAQPELCVDLSFGTGVEESSIFFPIVTDFQTFWESGAPGQPFFATLIADPSRWSDESGIKQYMNVKLEPASFWGWDGHIDTATGAVR